MPSNGTRFSASLGQSGSRSALEEIVLFRREGIHRREALQPAAAEDAHAPANERLRLELGGVGRYVSVKAEAEAEGKKESACLQIGRSILAQPISLDRLAGASQSQIAGKLLL